MRGQGCLVPGDRGGQEGGSRTEDKTIESASCAEEVAETLGPHPVMPPDTTPPWPVHLCPFPVSVILAWTGTPPPPPPCLQPYAVLRSSASSCQETLGSNPGNLLSWARPGL